MMVLMFIVLLSTGNSDAYNWTKKTILTANTVCSLTVYTTNQDLYTVSHLCGDSTIRQIELSMTHLIIGWKALMLQTIGQGWQYASHSQWLLLKKTRTFLRLHTKAQHLL